MAGDDRRHPGPRLAAGLRRVIALRETLRADVALQPRWMAVKQFQAQRLRATYPDLLAAPRFAPACEFFLEELYGPRDFELRDREALRIVPRLAAMLPGRAVEVIAEGIELDELSEQLDARLAAALPAGLAPEPAGAPLPETFAAAYAQAYRTTSTLAERQHQIDFILNIGTALEGIAKITLLPRLLRLMRGPAEVAGVGHLHRFLERGFQAFRGMQGAREFLDTVGEREGALMRRLFAGGPIDPGPAPGPLPNG